MALPGLDLDTGLDLPGLGNLPGLGRTRSETRMPFSPQDRQSYGKQLIGMGQGALGYALGALNKPGRAVRGVLAGRPSELANLIPFSDSMGITDPSKEVTGRHLLEHAGIIRPGDKGWASWGAGLGADIATDPLTYASFGAKHALNTAGQALMKGGNLQGWGRKALLQGFHDTESGLASAGHAPDIIAHMRNQGRRIATPAMEADYLKRTGQALAPNQPLSGLARVGIPFTDVGFSMGSGRMAQGVAGAMDKAGQWARYGNPVGLHAGALFDWNQNRALSKHTAQSWVNEGSPLRIAKEGEARAQHYQVADQINSLIMKHGNQYEVPISRAGQINLEGTSPLALLNSTNDPATRALYAQFLHETKPIGDQIANQFNPAMLEEQHRAGGSLAQLDDQFARYGNRQAFKAEKASESMKLDRNSILPTRARSSMQRQDLWRNIPGGQDRINDWVSRHAGQTDVGVSAPQILADLVADHTHVRGAAPTLLEMAGRKAVAKAPGQKAMPAVAGYNQKAIDIAKRIGGLDQKTYLDTINTNPFFTHDMASRVLSRGEHHARTMGGVKASVGALASAARPASELGTDYIPLARAMRGLGLVSRSTPGEMIGAAPEVLNRLASKGAPLTTPLTSGPGPYKGLHAELGSWGLDRNTWAGIKRDYRGWNAPEEMIAPLKGVDTFTNLFKALAYPTWIGSHTRNATTAAFNNMRTGTSLGDYWDQFKLMRGKVPEAVANPERMNEYAHAKIFSENSPLLETAGSTAMARPHAGRTFADYTPGTNGYGRGRVGPTGSFLGDVGHLLGKEGGVNLATGIKNKLMDWKNAPNPLQIHGAFGAEKDVFAPVVAGRKVGGNIEDFFRGAQYKGLIRQGYSPEMAGNIIEKYHFDYSHLTPMEKKVGRRVMPFYTYTRKNLPLQLETLATNPGTFSTPFKPTMVDRDKQEYVPGYLNNGFVAPIGPEVNGTRRFLTSLGLPQEEALKEMRLWNGKPDVQGTAMGLAANLNPLIKGPMEQLFGKQFFSGRNLSDLRPSSTVQGLSRALSLPDEAARPLTQWLANTPATRFLTASDKLLDTKGLTSYGRKPGWATALNLLTGSRISDVDMAKQRYLEERSANQALLQHQPHLSPFTNYYPRPADKALLTPSEMIQLRMQAALQQQGREYLERTRRGQ